MLKARASALFAGDLDGYLGPLTEEARAVEEPIARGAGSVPLASIDLTLGDARVGLDGSSISGAEVNFIYRYAELPEDNPFRFVLVTDLVRQDGSWTVASSTPDPEIPLPPWATGPVEVQRSPHFLALFRPGLKTADKALALGERAREQLFSRLTLVPDDTHLVILAGTSAEYGQLIGAPVAPGEVGKQVVAYRSTGGAPARPENRAMYVNLELVFDLSSQPVRFEDRADVFPVEVFQHELAHLALSRFDRPSTPSWIAEGGAMYLSGERRTDEWRSLLAQEFDGFSFVKLSERESLGSSIEYAYANAGISYIVEEYGVQKFWEFYRNFKDIGGGESPSGAKVVRRLVQRWFDIELEELDARTRTWVKKAVG